MPEDEEFDRNVNRGVWATFFVVVVTWVLLATGILLIADSCAKAHASPVYVTLESGFTAFKFGYGTTGAGFPHLETPKFDVEPGVEWSPRFLERRGVWLTASFRWQALGRWPREWGAERYVDGPRLGIRFRGRVTQ